MRRRLSREVRRRAAEADQTDEQSKTKTATGAIGKAAGTRVPGM